MHFLEENKIHLGDVRDLIKQIEPGSIALSVWSPPYFVGKEYEKYLTYNDWVELLAVTIKNHFNVLKPGGFLAVNIADILCFPDDQIPKYQSLNYSLQKSKVTTQDAILIKEQFPNYNRKQIANLLGCSEQTVDRRLNGNNIRGGKYNTMTRVHLVGDIIEKPAYDSGLYLYDRRIWKKDPCWQNSKWHNSSYRSVDEFEYIYIFWKPGQTTIDRKKLTPEEWKTWGSRGIWDFPSVRANNDHVAKFPIELPRRVIKLFTQPGETVLDCFMGSGTTAIAAVETKRNFIGIELLQEYVDLSNRNLKNSISENDQLKLL